MWASGSERMFSDWLVPHPLASLGLDDVVEPSQGPGPFGHTEHPAPTGASMATRAFTGLPSTNGGMEGGFTLADSGLENNELRAREEGGGMYLHLAFRGHAFAELPAGYRRFMESTLVEQGSRVVKGLTAARVSSRLVFWRQAGVPMQSPSGEQRMEMVPLPLISPSPGNPVSFGKAFALKVASWMMLPPALRLHALLSPPEFGMFHRTGAQTAVAVRFDSRSAVSRRISSHS
ncbi:unnamed protein product [Boreogadus saida]